MAARYFIGVLAVVCLVLLGTPLRGQQPTGSISGVVADPTGSVLPGASVTVTSQATRVTIELTTTEAGLYTAGSLLPGSYELRVKAEGFKTAVVHLKVEVGRVTPADVRLQVGTVAETVTVEADAVVVNPTQTALEGVVTGNLIRDLPLNGRNFLDLGQLEPGVQLFPHRTPTKGAFTALSVGGLSGQETRITLDGLDISDEIVGSNALNISQGSIQEFQISRSALDPSTGLSGGGAVNIVTKSGGNDFHGDAFLFLRTDDGAARVGQQRAPFDREQIGFSLGGPFIRDKLFWFVSYERNNQDGAVATQISGFPQFTGIWQVPFDERMVLGRVDWNITQNVRSFLRFTHNFNDGVATGRAGLGGTQLSPFASKNNTNQTAVGFDAAVRRYTHSFRYGHLDFNNFTEDAGDQVPGLPQTVDPAGRPLTVAFAPLALGALFGPGAPPRIGATDIAPLRLLQDNREFRYDGSFSFGRHTLRWGTLVNAIRVNWFASFRGSAPEIAIVFNLANQAICGEDVLCYPVANAIIANGLGSVTEIPTLGFPFGGGKNNRFHWYLADSWRATSRLSINYGVRYAYEPGQNHPDLVKPALLDEFMPGLARRDRRDKNNFAPHLGLAWEPTGSGKTVVRAGAGVYYDVNPFNRTLFARSEFLPPGISWNLSFPPFRPVIDPVTGAIIFDMNGVGPTALITPGVNWISGCSDPRFPGGECPLGTPGLIDTVFAAWDAFRATSLVAAANFPSGPTLFEITRRLIFAFDPNYKTPYSFQFNVGVQRELRPGLVLSVDYVRNRGLHYPLTHDLNRLAAADTLNVANALAAMSALHTTLGCPLGAAGVDCAIVAGATIEAYAANGLGRGQRASAAGPNLFAFPGLNPNFNSMNFTGMQGRFTYNALQVGLRGRLPDLGEVINDWTVVASYALSRLEGVSENRTLGLAGAINNDNLFEFFGPAILDRTHVFSLGNLFEIPGGFRLNSIWRFSSALPQSVFVPQLSGSPAEIFFTDFNGDGTVGDPLPGTDRGSFGRDVGSVEELNGLITDFNNNIAGTFTPAAQALIDAGLFTAAQLQALGAVANGGNPIPLAPSDQVMLDSFITTDLRISRPFKIREGRITVEPSFEWFNIFNIANYDLPGNKLNGLLTGTSGSINGTTKDNRPNRAGFGGGSFAPGIPRSWQFVLRVSF